MHLNRRSFLKTAGACSLLATSSRWSPSLRAIFADEAKRSYKVGVCDWNMPGYAANPESFAVAKELGFQGVQILYDPVDGPLSAKKENQDMFLQAAQNADMSIVSFSMGILNIRPFATEPDAQQWVSDCMDVMRNMKLKNLLLAFFSNGDLVDKPEDQKYTIAKLKNLAPQAEKLGLTLSIESYLDRDDHMKILDAVGSDAVKVYYDPQNMANKGYDVLKDIEFFGKKNLISEVHLKDDTHRLIDSPLQYAEIAKKLQDVEYSGWVVVEASISGDWKESYASNAAFARKIFNI